MNRTAITAERVRQLLDYNSETGILTWRVNRRGQVKVGAIAGTLSSTGYTQVKLDGRCYKAHRIAWLHRFGMMPKLQIDHINGDRLDNRLCNLRDVSQLVNNQNRRSASSCNTSGLLGVTHPSRDKTFSARIRYSGRKLCLGTFDTAEAAHVAYLDAKRKLHEGNTL